VHGVGQLTELDALPGQFLLTHELCNGKDNGPLAGLVPPDNRGNPLGVQRRLVGAEPGCVRLIEEVDAEQFGLTDKAIGGRNGDRLQGFSLYCLLLTFAPLQLRILLMMKIIAS
jgi:hypothetical protein